MISNYNILDTFRRLPDTSKETKERLHKHGQHKIGQGGYLRLKARIVSTKYFIHIIQYIIIQILSNCS
jgi:hypothetical protein